MFIAFMVEPTRSLVRGWGGRGPTRGLVRGMGRGVRPLHKIVKFYDYFMQRYRI